MTASLFSAEWYRVARLRPHLRAQVRVKRQHWRDQCWTLLTDEASGRQHRINEAAYQFIGRCDGQRTVHEVWNALLERDADAAPTQDEVLALLGQLGELELLQTEQAANAKVLMRRRSDRQRRRRRGFLNPFSFRLPIADPSAWLVKLDPLAQALFRPLTFWLWLTAMLLSAGLALVEWPALHAHGVQQFASAGNLAMAWLIYPLMKAVHELGHALAVRRWGGKVHEAGIGLLFLVPAPYVDASAATAFPRRSQRAIVGAAGVAVELSLAALGLLVWWLTQPGLVHNVAFAVMFIGTVSTVLFNGNPLMRFDGYYVFADWLEIPNLGQRSTSYVAYLVQRHAFGLRELHSPAASRGEARWLLAYGLGSVAYRTFISFSIILLVASKFFFAGVLLAIWGVAVMLLRPIAAGAWFVFASPGLAAQRRRAATVTLAALLAAGIFLFLVPAPQWSRAEGVVWVPERAQVRAEASCWLREVIAAPGAPVARDAPLIRCEDPELATNASVLEAQLVELRARDMAYFVDSRLHLDIVREEIAATEAKLVEARRKLAGLLLRSPVAGVFVIERPLDAPGRYVRRGELIAYVLEEGAATVRAVVEQDDVDLVRGATRAVAIKPADRVWETIAAKVGREVPGATDRLPSAALAVPGGGQFGVDPRGLADSDAAERPKILTPVFQFDLDIAPGVRLDALGMRVHVRFEHETAPIGVQAWRAVRRLLLRRFEV